MNVANTIRALGLVSAVSLATWAQAYQVPVTMLNADFEGDLSGWTERRPANPSGLIVADPVNSGRGNVLMFQQVGSSGTLFSNQAVTSGNGKFLMTFDYLGLMNQGGIPGDLGGYIGVVPAMGEDDFWVGGTGSHPTPLDLIDDGQWHSYSFTFTSQWGNTLRVMAQDWGVSAGPVPRNVFFDNITLQAVAEPVSLKAVPEPTSLALVGLALAAVGATASRRKGQGA